MAEEQLEYWQITAQMYEQLIQKPKMSQKLLCKPPFRYIHDIFSATCEATGFGQGLYQGEELDGKSIAEKEAKINWLVKLLQLTELVVGEQIDCKPTKVVAGHEPENTNFFLQQLFRAATAGIDTTPHVMQVLGIANEDEEEQPMGDDPEAIRQAELEQQERERQMQEQEAEKKKKKKADQEERRRKEEAQRQKEEDEQRMQQEQEMQDQQRQAQQQEEKQRKKQADADRQKQQIMRETSNRQMHPADDDEDEEEQPVQEPQSNFQHQDGERHGALYEEARKLMADDDDVQPEQKEEKEESGPKIKMGRIGKKKKGKNGTEKDNSGPQDNYTKQIKGLQAVQSTNPGGGFNDADIEFMKKAIQVLCQSTNPLGKSIDYVSDDVDSMSKEYEHWRKEAIQCTHDLDDQKKLTDEIIQPLQHSLAELEEKIREQQSKVTSIRSQILRNDITVSNLLYSVIQTR